MAEFNADGHSSHCELRRTGVLVGVGSGGVLCHCYVVPRNWERWVMRFLGLAPTACVSATRFRRERDAA